MTMQKEFRVGALLRKGHWLTGGCLLMVVILPIGGLRLEALTFDEAMDRAMGRAPQLEAASASLEASRSAVKQAETLKNPTLSFEAENFGGNNEFGGSQSAEYTVSVEQALEFGRKRRAQRALAETDVHTAELAGVLLEQELKAELRRRFMTALHASKKKELALEALQSARAAADAVAVQKGVGAAAGLEMRRARVVVSQAQIGMQQAEQSLMESLERLATLWNGTGDFEIEGNLSLPEDLPDFTVFQQLLQGSVRMQLLGSARERQVQTLAIERAKLMPEVSVGLGHRWFEAEDANAWVAGLSVSLPIFDRNQHQIEMASAGLRGVEADRILAERQLKDELNRIYRTLSSTHSAATQIQAETLPLARETYALVDEGYRLGRYELLYLLESRRTLLEVEKQWIELLAEFHLAAANLEALVGAHPFPEKS